MSTPLSPVIGASLVMALCGCTATMTRGSPEPPPSLVGAWIVTSERSAGVGKNMLTFSSDHTFLRSGDTHPTLSAGHGAWKQVGPGRFEAVYIAFRFDDSRKWVGSTRTSLQLSLGATPSEFVGTADSVTLDLEDQEVRRGHAQLSGRRITVGSP